jgi:SAM-dependent methyltransferase
MGFQRSLSPCTNLTLLRIAALLVAGLLGMTAGTATVSCGQAPDTTAGVTVQEQRPQAEGEEVAVPYVTTPPAVVDAMLTMAGVTASDVVYDLGSGDGRIPIRAAQEFGAQSVGIEIKPELVEKARARARAEEVADQVEFRRQDLFEADISEATVVTLYLLPNVNLKLRPKLFRGLDPGTWVVSHGFDMGEWTPISTKEVQGRRLYLWRIPEEPPDFIEQP